MFLSPGSRQRVRSVPVARNNRAPQVNLYNVSDLSTANFFGNNYRLQVIANRAGIISQQIQNTNNTNFPSAISGNGWVRAGGEGTQSFGVVARATAEVAGGVSNEFDAYNNSTQDAPTTVPRNDIPGTTSTWTTSLSLSSGSTTGKVNWAALYITQDGNSPIQFNYGIYYHPSAVKVTGLYIDADATHSPTTSAFIKNTGQGSNIHGLFQTTGTAVAKNPFLGHLNSSGVATFQVNQDGSIISTANAVATASPTPYGWYFAGLDSTSTGGYFDTFAAASLLRFRRADGTGASPGNIATSDIVGLIASQVRVNGAYTTDTARITFIYTGAGGASADNGTQIQLSTTPNASTALTQAVIIQGSGGIAIGSSTDPGTGGLLCNVAAGIGTNTLTSSFLAITAGTTAKSQINFGASTAPTSPNNGDFWFDGTNFKARVGGVTKTFTII